MLFRTPYTYMKVVERHQEPEGCRSSRSMILSENLIGRTLWIYWTLKEDSAFHIDEENLRHLHCPMRPDGIVMMPWRHTAS